MPDGVDYVPLPKWKNQLIQLLNIAGVGPVIGVIAGIKFGKIALLIIPVGCVFMGAVHDFLGGMLSIRMNGANLPAMIRKYLGRGYASVFSGFMVILLLLVVAVFINVPANLIDQTWLPDIPFFWWAVLAIFVYYVVATLFPVDKIIGAIYPFFGAVLMIGSGAPCGDADGFPPSGTPPCFPNPPPSSTIGQLSSTPTGGARSSRCFSSPSPAASSPDSTPRSRPSSPARYSPSARPARPSTA
ncbi:MAG: carbon starvation CstA family protein [Kiritimatiellia bacterium]